ncbi:hypothetical protein BT63DRAFT_20605 [Microthyrium microscopicum]|uniref:Uncharacterized protein n=1 Tax=Microthyrium microscopicum TaxID=703497 RepID=A0A6A6USQ7_9PEZI|nr:hypothetical protein BT63DRAFT_20605 [Microthyrium microscopicum]
MPHSYTPQQEDELSRRKSNSINLSNPNKAGPYYTPPPDSKSQDINVHIKPQIRLQPH